MMTGRYYDMSMETSADAMWPVIPCLVGLWARLYWIDTVEAIDRYELPQTYLSIGTPYVHINIIKKILLH